MISKKLVTFHDIQELQQNNQKLLVAIRDLSEEFEKAEVKLKAYNKEELEVIFRFSSLCVCFGEIFHKLIFFFQNKVANLENSLREREESFTRQEKIIQMFKNQIKMYKLLGINTFEGGRSFDGHNISVSNISILKLNLFSNKLIILSFHPLIGNIRCPDDRKRCY